MERIAHRGAKREHVENTIAAFKAAFDRRADAIELDVHGTRDGVVVVHHDPALGPAFGGLSGQAIADLDWSAIAQAATTSKARVPTLSEVFGITPPGATVYVEIKGQGIESLVAQLLQDTNVRVAVHSFDREAVQRMRKLLPQVPRGILFDRRPKEVEADMRQAGARDVWPEWRLIDDALVKRVHAAGGRVIAWTVNDKTVAGDLIALGVDGICTDDVRLLDGLEGASGFSSAGFGRLSSSQSLRSLAASAINVSRRVTSASAAVMLFMCAVYSSAGRSEPAFRAR